MGKLFYVIGKRKDTIFQNLGLQVLQAAVYGDMIVITPAVIEFE